MKEPTADSEGPRNKVGFDQQKPLPSSGSATESSVQSPESSTKKTSNKEGASKNSLFVPSNNQSNTSNGDSTSNTNNNNFDDDCEWGDISIGNLIIDLDADIERQSEGDKNSADCPSKTSDSGSKKCVPETNKETLPTTPQPFLDLSEPVMSSNLKSPRVNPLTSSASSPLSVGNNSSALVVPATTAANTTNGANSGTSSSGHHHHSHNQRNANYSLATNNSSTKNPSAKSQALVEHHATVDKGLKMKIKRKNIGGNISETKHEIVSSDISLQSSKPYINGPYDPNSSNVAPSAPTPNNVTNPPVLLPSSALNSVIIASAEGALSPLNDMSSKLSKHSNKIKSSHHGKKDKIVPQNDKHNLPVNSCPMKPRPRAEDNTESASSISSISTQSGIPNLALKYSTPSPTVMQPDETTRNKNTSLFNVKKVKTDDIDENISETKSVGTSTSVASITEPDCLGPCEPGTSVTLEGIVWQETEGGVLVVNVTWRGKTYVGTLLSASQHDWAPPRLCDSPTSDIESKSMKNTRGKRARNSLTSDTAIDTRSVTSKLRNGKGRRTANSGYILPSPAKGDSLMNSSKRKGRPSDLDLSALDDSYKRNRASKSDSLDGHVPTSPVLIECPEPNCSKKYKHINGLKYHQSHAHFGSTFNINDSQDFSETTNSETNAPYSAKDDASDDESNLPEYCTKDSSNNLESGKSESANTLKNSQIAETTKPNNDSANNQLLVSENNCQQVSDNNKNGEIGDDSLNSENTNKRNEVGNAETVSAKCSESNRDSVNTSRDVIFPSNAVDVPLTKASESFHSKRMPSAGDIKEQEDIENVASPAYSDISDDTNLNDNASEIANHSTQPLDKGDPASDIKKSQALNNFGLSSYSPYYNQQYNPAGSTTESETKNSVGKSSTEMGQPLADLTSQNPYSYPFYRLNALSSQDSKNMSENISKMNSNPLNSQPSANLNRTDEQFAKDRTAESIRPIQKESEPIAELQNLKNRISNFAYDQGPLYDTKRFISDADKEKNKEKPKHLSPQHSKPHSSKEEKDKSSVVKVDEGVKPTMETTGPPPPPTNGYNFLNSHFLQPFQAMSPFESMFRNATMNPMVMGSSPYGPHASFIHSQMRFSNPHSGLQTLDGLPMSNPNSRPSQMSSAGPPTTTTPGKTSSHLSSSSFPTSKSERSSILSPTTSSGSNCNNANLLSSASYHKSPSKEFAGGMIPPCPSSAVSSVSDQRTLMTTASSSLHPQRHPFPTSHVGYPIFDPYNAMIVNHAANSVPMHPFTPK